ncbi:hypothetical protein ORN01_22130 [Bacillus cereus]|uniref:hypothetical protein n=1 Tax=Bacillus cereus group TaxID=86661 RepID=UPI000279D213|nr:MULTISPECIES: hypothetical protein [Bacillus cereus group]EJR73629.1 hypothetical protein IK9_05164 [Bacillus cereus VD166]MDZ4631672.1 hypothetical protein [Bacillus cereus]USL10756.1 hypothetical protein LIT24_28865 [Bacillus bombysepticus]
MDQSLLERIIRIDENDELNVVRILILIDKMAGRNHKQTIDGINKLVKLDFLLRYPVALERALMKLKKETDIPKIDIKVYERESVETNLMHFNYGPWDSRYRRFLTILEAKGLIAYIISGKTVKVSITHTGHKTVENISRFSEFQDYVVRSQLIKRHFGSYSSKKLLNFFYEVFPEMVTMTQGEEIKL